MTAKIYKFPARGRNPVLADNPVWDTKPLSVLLIVGEDETREMLAEVLASSGFEVTPHKLDPRHYPAMLRDMFAEVRFDIVIPTNLGIPFAYVPKLVSLVQKYGEGAGIIVISGWIQDDFVAELARTPRTAFFPAPFQMRELVAKIRELAFMRTAGLPILRVLAGDAMDNSVGKFILDWLTARYDGIRNVRGRCVSSGEEILRIAAKVSIDLFVLNFTPLWSPGNPFKDHIDFARHLKKKYSKPIFMITGFAEPELRKQALAAGVDAYFVYPYQLEELGAKLNKLLNIREKA